MRHQVLSLGLELAESIPGKFSVKEPWPFLHQTLTLCSFKGEKTRGLHLPFEVQDGSEYNFLPLCRQPYEIS